MIYFRHEVIDRTKRRAESLLATMLVCPRCRGTLQPDARACPRCGLVLDGLQLDIGNDKQEGASYSPTDEYSGTADARPITYAVDTGQSRGGTLPYDPTSAPVYAQPVRGRQQSPAGNTAAPAQTPSARLVPRGAVELLPQESVAFQLGALYLTNKRIILLAPSVIRAAFLHDIDAVGTLTERASGWSLFFGLLLLGLAAAGGYASVARQDYESLYPDLYRIDPVIIAGALALLGLILLATYFFWVKRTLFVSVKGRPLITVSISDWNTRKLEGMDAFVNAFFQVKDAIYSGGPLE
jgi:ribosomal protein L40E